MKRNKRVQPSPSDTEATETSEPSETEPGEPVLCRFQKYVLARVHRSQLLNAPYNPRKIDARARDKLKRNLKTVGLTEAPTWNVTTGNVVAGHQRLAILDLLEGHDNYLLDVCQVELSEKVEREQNVFMNNPMAQGDWDLTVLAPLLKTPDFDKAASGWDRLDLEVMFSDTDLSGMFTADEAAKEVLADLARFAPPKPAPSPVTDPAEPGEPGDDEGDEGDEDGDDDEDDDDADDDTLPTEPPDEVATEPPQRRSDAVKEYMNTRNAQNDTELYAVVVFASRREREIFMSALGQPTNVRYIDGAKVLSRLGIDPDDAQWKTAFDSATVPQ